VGPHHRSAARTEIDCPRSGHRARLHHMLAHPEESLFADGRALSDLQQGVTLEVMGEFSMGPVTQKMAELMVARQDDIKYPVTWTTLGQYLETLERRGISPNVASFVGASTVRTFVWARVTCSRRLRNSTKCAAWFTARWKKEHSG